MLNTMNRLLHLKHRHAKTNFTLKVLALIIVALFLSRALLAQTRFKSLNYLYSISGSYTVSGQHNDQKDGTNENYWTNQVFAITGKYPALWSGDFLFHGNSSMRWALAYEAERQWNKGAIINFMWHVCPPNQGGVCNWDGGVKSSLSSSEWSSLLTNGGSLNNTWKQRIDSDVAPYLQYLKDKGVEVMWRPLHEENQTVFWWNSGGAGNTKALWRLTYDYMTTVKGLTNLIWVWDVQDLSTNYGDYNPGSNYFDIAALDIYGGGFSNTAYYNALVTQAAGKPVVIGECFTLPSASALNSMPKMSFFMEWAYGLKKDDNGNPTNSDDYIRQVYSNPRVITLDEMPGWNNVGVPANLAKGKSVTVSSTETGGNVATNAVDGNYGTRWSSTYFDNQWIRVDLGATYNVNRVKLTWEAAYANSYRIEMSADGNTWATIKTVTGKSSSAADDWTGLSGSGRYLRIWGITRATTYGVSLFEIEAYGTAGGGGSSNLALNKTVTSTSDENTTNSKEKGVDGNAGTRWSSQYADNQNYIIDLGARYNINRVKIVWEAAFAKDYQIQIAETQAGPWPNLKEVYGKTSSAADDWTGLSGTGRYLKVYCITRATTYGFSFFEIEAYGTAAARSATEEVASNTEQDLVTAYPNPTSGNVTIAVNLPRAGHARINVTGILGNNISELHNGHLEAGKHEFIFNTENVAPGLLTYSIHFEGSVKTKKLLKQ
jgi:mannan endo-1,4-beta-mannosidase